MKRLILATAAAAAMLAAAPAMAADLPEYAPAPVVSVPSFSWTGFYVGAHAGYAWGDHKVRTSGRDAATVANVANGLRPARRSIDGKGLLLGGQVGYNQQFGNVVAGLEADLSFADIDDTASFTAASPPGAPVGVIRSRFKQELDYLGTVRARLGFAFNRFLVYGTGGLAYGDVKTKARFFNNSATGGALGFSGNKSGVEYGYAVGAGVEYAVTDHVTVRGEYLYYDLGKTKLKVNNTGAGPAGQVGYNSRFETDGHILRVGLNYKF